MGLYESKPKTEKDTKTHQGTYVDIVTSQMQGWSNM